MKATADIGNTTVTSTVLATRGQRLVLTVAGYSGVDPGWNAFATELLNVSEIHTDNKLSAMVLFDADDIDAAFTELESCYVAGDGAAYAHTWSIISNAYTALNRRDLPPVTTDFTSIDHRRVAAYAPGDLLAYIHAGWKLEQNISTRIEAVHRLTNFGAVVTHAARGTSQDGFDAEWRGIDILTVDGDLISRSEVFDEDDLDAALARFDELAAPKPRA